MDSIAGQTIMKQSILYYLYLLLNLKTCLSITRRAYAIRLSHISKINVTVEKDLITDYEGPKKLFEKLHKNWKIIETIRGKKTNENSLDLPCDDES